ncbi:MAG: peptidylprolyl isomerase [Lachnospiraceae bacterium]|nr:peptidylprolyl isomerase [Lachnospiraceae bacterium]
MKKSGALAVMLVMLAALCLAGCGRGAKKEEQEIVLTTGFEENEIFFIGTERCTVPELNVYVRTSQGQYEGVFGEEIWDRDIGTETLEQYLKRMALYRLARIKAMKLLAETQGISLDESESDKCLKAAKEYFASLSEADKNLLGADEELINRMYSEFALADKVYKSITDDVNPEISDDEARTITVKQILIKTFYRDVSGNRIDYNEKQKREAYERASTMHKRLENGEDFDALAARYNEDSQIVYSFDKDSSLPKEFVDTAFNMETDEVSDIIETPFGYHVLKCVSTFDREETDENKLKILNKKKEEVFSKTYDEFVQSQYSGLNDELYNATTYDRSALETKESFFDVYNRIFEEDKGQS